jgi:urease accessory protein
MRATRVIAVGHWDAATAIDRVVLDSDQRSRRRAALTGAGGTAFLLDLSRPPMLREGDGLVLEDDNIVRVCAQPEPLLEIAVAETASLARLAWHLGNRHVAVQMTNDRLRIRRDHVLAEMLQALGARLESIDAPFEPERGAYAQHWHDESP